MARKIPPKNPYGPQEDTNFKRLWGESAFDLAAREGVTVDAIHMRVYKWKSPWQRKSKPTICELLHGKTLPEIARELQSHPSSVHQRAQKYKNAYWQPPFPRKKKYVAETLEQVIDRYDDRTWLMPEHPDYENFFNRRNSGESKTQ